MSGISAMFFGSGSSGFLGTWTLGLGGVPGLLDAARMALGYDGAGVPYALVGSSGNAKGAGFQVNTARETVWTRSVAVSGLDETYGVAADSASNMLMAVRGPSPDSYVVKVDTSGTVTWQRKLSSASRVSIWAITVDGSDNVYVCGTASTAFVAKYNSSGVLQWQRTLSGGSLTSISCDGSGNVYLGGQLFTGGVYKPFFAKYDTSGAIQWQQTVAFSGPDEAYTVRALTADASGNLYCSMYYQDSVFGSRLYYVKLNSSGVFQWGRESSATVTFNQSNGGAVAIDAAGYIYFGNNVYNGGDYAVNIMKFNSSGTLQFSYDMVPSNIGLGCYGLVADNRDYLWISGGTGSSTYIFLGRIPREGTATGTYNLPTTPSSSITCTRSTPTLSTVTFTVVSTSFTDAAGALTDAAGALTSGTFSTTAYTTAV